MPGPFIHIAVADHLRVRLTDQKSWSDLATLGGVPALSGPVPANIADWAKRHPSYYALGAVGPDLFFFLPDFRAYCEKGRGGPGRRVPIANSLIGVAEWLEDFYAKLDSWILEDWERYFGPGSENTEEAISRFTGDLSTLVSDITAGFAAVGTTALLSLASQAHDWWGLFSLGLNKGYDNQDFFWSDMLHYRKTSRFGRSLWEIANEREATGLPTPEKATEIADQLRAYALGYITHLAADTAGHPFVNEKSGGPFRTHWQRHHLVENHMDAQTYDDEHGGDDIYNELTESGLHYRIAFKDDGADGRSLPQYTVTDNADTLQDLYVRRRHLDLDSEMPPELADLLFKAMGKTFNTAAAPTLAGAADSSPRIIMGGDGRPDVATIRLAYDICFRYLKLSMLDGFKHEKPKPPLVIPNFQPPLLTDPHDDPPNEGDPDMSFWDWVLAILRFIRWLAAVAIWLATILPAMALDVATYLPRLIAYYTIELPLYYMVKAERRIMVMSGFLHPMKDEIDKGLVRLCVGHDDFFLSMLKSMNDSLGGIEDNGLAAIGTQAAKLAEILGLSAAEGVAQMLGVSEVGSTEPTEPAPNANYPHSQPLDSMRKPVEYHAPWQYPTSPTELNPTFAGPYECGDMPHILLDGGMTGDQAIRAKYEHAKTPAETDQISFTEANKVVNLGDPINFAAYLTWQLTRNQPPKGSKSSVTDWNLDADRGYAYKCWDWNRHFVPKTGASTEHILLDMEGHSYMEPCTPPPQTEDPNTKGGCAPPPTMGNDPEKPLDIHYADEPDPGC
jgi:hypothetical protein